MDGDQPQNPTIHDGSPPPSFAVPEDLQYSITRYLDETVEDMPWMAQLYTAQQTRAGAKNQD